MYLSLGAMLNVKTNGLIAFIAAFTLLSLQLNGLC